MAVIRREEVERLAGDRSYADYILAARRRFEQGHTATVQELRRVYRRAAAGVRDDIENAAVGSLRRAHLEALARNLERRARELSAEVLTATTRGIHLAVDTGSLAAQNITARLVRDLWDPVEVGRLFAALNERAVMSVLARTGKDGLRLSDRIWRVGERWRNAVTRVVEDGVARGLDPRKLAREVERYLKPGAWSAHKLETRRRLKVPADVSYEAMRLARTEMGNAFHEASILSNRAAPSYLGIYWRLSAEHPAPDVCDDYATHDGTGFWRSGEEPVRPHPQCFCVPVPCHEDPDQFVERLRAWRSDPTSQPDIEDWFTGRPPGALRRPGPTQAPPGQTSLQGYVLSGGQKRDCLTSEIRPGTRLIWPHDLDTTKQNLSLDAVKMEFRRLPEPLQKAVREIQLVDYRNPADYYWEKEYGIPDFRSFAVGGRGNIIFFENGFRPASSNASSLKHVMAHEAAHNWDQVLGQRLGIDRFSRGPEWTGAQATDHASGASEWVSKYAAHSRSIVEDFADAVAEYYLDRQGLETRFPARYSLIEREMTR